MSTYIAINTVSKLIQVLNENKEVWYNYRGEYYVLSIIDIYRKPFQEVIQSIQDGEFLQKIS